MTGEIRRMKLVHVAGRPSISELRAMFPRHSAGAVSVKATELGLRKRTRKPKRMNSQTYWLKIAHLHFERRETGSAA